MSLIFSINEVFHVPETNRLLLVNVEIVASFTLLFLLFNKVFNMAKLDLYH